MGSHRQFIYGLITTVALLLPASAHATFPGANGKIAFVRSNDVWRMNPDGSNQTNITNTPTAIEDAPAWSADGMQIAYVRDRAIWTMNADGTLPTQVVPAPTTFGCNPFPQDALDSPAWSPDGSKIVFVRFTCTRDPDQHETPSYDLYTVNPDGTGEKLLVKEGTNPRWSPDGTKVGYTFFCYGGGCTDVRWTTPDGSQQFVVYSSNVQDETFIDWSPWEQLIDGTSQGLYYFTIHPDGTGYSQFPSGVVPGRWSPDGTKFVLSGVYTENKDGSGKTQVATGTAPDWQPITNYARPRGATPIEIALVPAYNACTSPNTSHGGGLSYGSCTPPTQTSSQLTVGTPDANGQGAKLQSKILYGVGGGDVGIIATITDVRNKSDLSDYTGELSLSPGLRITDKNNTPGPGPGTVSDTTLPVTIPCAATTDTTIGSTCSLSTTVNSVYPGAVVAGKRAIWQLGQVRVYDGGTDGLASTTADNTLFLDQGVFVP